jgi:hypothetical protein
MKCAAVSKRTASPMKSVHLSEQGHGRNEVNTLPRSTAPLCSGKALVTQITYRTYTIMPNLVKGTNAFMLPSVLPNASLRVLAHKKATEQRGDRAVTADSSNDNPIFTVARAIHRPRRYITNLKISRNFNYVCAWYGPQAPT